MSKTRRLEMVFNNNLGGRFTIALAEPSAIAKPAETRALMVSIVNANAFSATNGATPTGVHSARIVERDVIDVAVV